MLIRKLRSMFLGLFHWYYCLIALLLRMHRSIVKRGRLPDSHTNLAATKCMTAL